jgi:hypothetical protein
MDQTRFEKIRETLREAQAKWEEYEKARVEYQNYLRETLRSHGLEHKSEDEIERLAPEICKDLNKRFLQVLSIWSNAFDLQDKAIEIRLQEDPILTLCWERLKNRKDYKSVENLYKALGLGSLKWVKSTYLRGLIREKIDSKDRKQLLEGAVAIKAHEAIGSYHPDDLLDPDNPLERIFKEITNKIYAQAQKDLESGLPIFRTMGGKKKYQFFDSLPENLEAPEPIIHEEKAANVFSPELWEKLTEEEQKLVEKMYNQYCIGKKPHLSEKERQVKHRLKVKLRKLTKEIPS